jgi:predicted DNA-binding protein (UPF0251 family)
LQNLVDFAAAKNRVVLNLKELRLVDREEFVFSPAAKRMASSSTPFIVARCRM